MVRTILVVLALAAVVHAQGRGRGKKEPEDNRQTQKINDLMRDLRDLNGKSLAGIARASDQKRIIEEIAKINHPQAVRALVAIAEDAQYAAVREDLLKILSELPSADESLVERIMCAHIAPDDPVRGIARKYLLEQAVRRRKDQWPIALFYAYGTTGSPEDKFLALQVLGRIQSERTLECATRLANDTTWTPDPSGLISCGTIATAVERFEGAPAAQLLLCLAKDARFTQADAAKVRDATRTWHETDLRSYVKLAELTDRDPLKRQVAAKFYGVAGIESARAPLVRVAFNRKEVPEVRAAAATALGGLRVAREDLAEHLGRLLADPVPQVRAGAIEGVHRLNVIQGMQALVSMLDGPYAAEARAALSRFTGLPPETDWKEWLRKAGK